MKNQHDVVELELAWDSTHRKMKVSLDGELEKLLRNGHQLPLRIVERLVQLALEGAPGISIRALELLFNRVDGPVQVKQDISDLPLQRVVITSQAAAEGLAAARLGLLAAKSEILNGITPGS